MTREVSRLRSLLKDWRGAPRDPEPEDFPEVREEDRPAVVRAAAAVRAAWGRGDTVATHAAVMEGAETLAETVRFAETAPASEDPRELARQARHEPNAIDDNDPESPRTLAREVRAW
jgi:hypothetical protein